MADDGRPPGEGYVVEGYVVSLIVPIFDVEDYLEECLASVAAQSVFGDVEVVLLDDGSTDGSGAIAARFAEGRPNVRLVTQANAGLGAARNAALTHATAPLVTFLDSDDVLPLRSLEQRVAAMTDDVDVVVGGMAAFPAGRQWEWAQHFRPGETVVLDTLSEHPDLLYNASVANKVFRRSQLDRLGARFAEGRHFEDAWVSIPALLDARRVALVGDVTYLYRQRGTSIMGSIFTRPENYEDQLVLVEHLLAASTDVDQERRRLLQTWAAHATSGFLRRVDDVLEPDAFADFFARSRALFADVPVEVLVPAAVNLPGRVPFVGLLEDRPELLDLDTALSAPLLVRDDALLLDLGARVAHEPLLRVRRPKARVLALNLGEVAGAAVVDLAVRTDVPNHVPLGAELRLTAGDVSVPLEATGLVGTRERTLRAVLPLDGLAVGRHPVRLVLVTATGAIDVGVSAADSAESVDGSHASDLGWSSLPEDRRVRGDIGPKGGLGLRVEAAASGLGSRVARGLRGRLPRLGA